MVELTLFSTGTARQFDVQMQEREEEGGYIDLRWSGQVGRGGVSVDAISLLEVTSRRLEDGQ